MQAASETIGFPLIIKAIVGGAITRIEAAPAQAVAFPSNVSP
jgi:hypothetical protein